MCSGATWKLLAMVGSAVASTVPSSCSMNIALATISDTMRALGRIGAGPVGSLVVAGIAAQHRRHRGAG